MQENPEYSVFSLQTMGFYCIFVGLFRKLGIFAKSNPKVGQNVYKFNRIFRNLGKFGAKYPIITMSSYILWRLTRKIGKFGTKCPMATLIMDFPEYSGYPNQIVTSSWGFFRKFGKFLPQIHSFFCQRQNYWH